LPGTVANSALSWLYVSVKSAPSAFVPQVIRMKISGHKTDSMERRYNIVDGDDLAVAKEFMERGMKLRKSVVVL
jgi:hypothetical protein